MAHEPKMDFRFLKGYKKKNNNTKPGKKKKQPQNLLGPLQEKFAASWLRVRSNFLKKVCLILSDIFRKKRIAVPDNMASFLSKLSSGFRVNFEFFFFPGRTLVYWSRGVWLQSLFENQLCVENVDNEHMVHLSFMNGII